MGVFFAGEPAVQPKYKFAEECKLVHDLLKAFGLDGKHVVEFHLYAKVGEVVKLSVMIHQNEISEDTICKTYRLVTEEVIEEAPPITENSNG
jgi:hypothetical protein